MPFGLFGELPEPNLGSKMARMNFRILRMNFRVNSPRNAPQTAENSRAKFTRSSTPEKITRKIHAQNSRDGRFENAFRLGKRHFETAARPWAAPRSKFTQKIHATHRGTHASHFRPPFGPAFWSFMAGRSGVACEIKIDALAAPCSQWAPARHTPSSRLVSYSP